MTLRFLVFGALSLATMIPLVLFWAWPHSRAMQDEMDAVVDRNLQIAETLASALGRYERDLRAFFDFLAVQLVDGESPAGGAETSATFSLLQVCFVEPGSGRVLGGLAVAGDCPTSLAPERLAFLTDLAQNERSVTGGVVAGEDGQPALILGLRHADRLAYGLASTKPLTALAKGVAFGENGHAAIVDGNGLLIAHPLEDWSHQRRDLSELAPVRAALRGEKGIGRFTSLVDGTEMVAGYAPVPGAGWAVLVPQQLSELKAAVRADQGSALSVLAVGALAAAAISWLLSGLLIRPVRAVVEAAGALARGESSPQVGGTGRMTPRELKELRSAFVEMAESVAASRSEQEEARQMAEEAYLTRSRFLAHMSHEIRTPLNAVIGFSEAMLEKTHGPIGAPKYEEYLRDIHESAHHLLSLINDLLDLSRVDVEDQPFEEIDVPLDQIMALSSALIQPRAREKAISVAVTTEPPDLRLLCDQRLLRRALLHLLSNAVTFTGIGGWVLLRARVLNTGELQILIEDNGQGMTAEEREKALRTPIKVPKSDPWGRQSSGRGLAIVSRLVERHGGSFSLESEPGLGTTAIITLPAHRILEAGNFPDRDPVRLKASGL